MAFLALATVAGTVTHAQTPSTETFQSDAYRYAVTLPAGCRYQEGPGTLDAVCSAEMDAEKSALASAAESLVLEVSAEAVADDAGKPVAALAERYDTKEFRAALPEAVCGEADATRVKIANVQQVLESERVVYTADVVCPEVRFLGLGERLAAVRFLVTPGLRYRLMARAPKEEFERRQPAVDAFFSSFRMLPAG
jgi:hypothetical protein